MFQFCRRFLTSSCGAFVFKQSIPSWSFRLASLANFCSFLNHNISMIDGPFFFLLLYLGYGHSHVCMLVYMCACMYVCMCMGLYVCMHACMYVFSFIFTPKPSPMSPSSISPSMWIYIWVPHTLLGLTIFVLLYIHKHHALKDAPHCSNIAFL